MYRSIDPFAEEDPSFGFGMPSPHAPADQALIGVKTPLGWARPRWTGSGSMWLDGEDFSYPLSRFDPGTLEPVFGPGGPRDQPRGNPFHARGPSTDQTSDDLPFAAVETGLGRARPILKPSGELLLEIDGQRRPLHHFDSSQLRVVEHVGSGAPRDSVLQTMEQRHPLDKMLTSSDDNHWDVASLPAIERGGGNMIGAGAFVLDGRHSAARGLRSEPINALWTDQRNAHWPDRNAQAPVTLLADYRRIPPGVQEVVRGARQTQAELEQSAQVALHAAQKILEANPHGSTRRKEVPPTRDREAAGVHPLGALRDLTDEARGRADRLQDAVDNARRRAGQARRDAEQGLHDFAEEKKRQAAQAAAEAAAQYFIPQAIRSSDTSKSAKEVLTSFWTGKGQRHFEYGEESEAAQELLAADPGGYFQGQINDMAAYMANRDQTPYLRDGQQVTNFKGKKFGNLSDVGGLGNGTQIGDVVGSMRWEATVKDGIMHITANNATTLESFSVENRARHGLVSGPKSGPLSPVTQTFKFTAPVPDKYRAPDKRE